MYSQAIINEIEAYYGSIEAGREEYRRLAKDAKNQGDAECVSVTSFGQLVIDHSPVEYDQGDCCPVHGSEFKRCYTFGSSMSAETEVSVFRGCKCAIAERHDPVGTYESVVTFHRSYDGAYGVGRLHAEMAKVKYA